MLDLGVGQALEKESRGRREGREGVRSGGAVVTEVDGMLTREMLDGLDNFWRARCGTIFPGYAGRTRQGAALYLQMGRSGAKLSGVDVIRVSTPPWRSGPQPQNCSAISTT
jgi:aspartyl-tRNA(Asn)/glutamyl-tRNA(Gln) amidotransferase subunit A